MPGAEERREAFSMYRDFLMEYDFSSSPELFMTLVGVSLEGFCEITVDEYFERRNAVLPREKVLREFQSGRIGLRWIVKYFIAWFKFKIKKS